MKELLQQRLEVLRGAQSQHVKDAAYYGQPQEHHEYVDEHDGVAFKHQDDFAYYQSLRGHIEEVKFLLAAVK